jgi:cobalt-zinc-cadmium efflux system outer membrane protein
MENIAGSENFSGIEAAELTIALSSVIELGDQRQARLAVVGGEQARLDVQRRIEALDLLGEVTRRFVDLLEAQEMLAVLDESAQLARDALSAVREHAAAGAVPKAEVSGALAALAQARIAASAAKRDIEYARVALAAMWGQPNPDFETATGELYAFAQDLPFAELLARAEANPAITLFASERRLREAELRLAQSESSVDLAWSVGVRRFQDQDANALVAGVSVPLFTGRRNQGEVIAARAELDALPLEREAALLRLHTQLYRAFSGRRQAIETVSALRDEVIPLLSDALEESQEAFEQGLYGYADWAGARQQLIEAHRAAITAASAALRYGAEIEQLSAEDISAAP